MNEDTILYMYSFCSYKERIKLSQINKKMYIFHKKNFNHIQKIQKILLDNLYYTMEEKDINLFCKQSIIQKLNKEYPWYFYKTYCSFLVSKCKLVLLEEEVNKEKYKYCRENISNFLQLKDITKEDILYAGF